MNIAQVVSTFPPYKAGIGNSAYHLSWELATFGHDISVYTIYRHTATALEGNFPFKIKRLYPWIRYGNAGFVPQLLWQLRGHDIIHLHYPFFGGAEMIFFLEKFSHINLIIHYHMDVVGEGLKKSLFDWHSNHVLPRIMQRANKIIVTSLDYAEQSRIAPLLHSDADKVVEIPLGVNPKLFKPRMKHRDLIEKHKLENKKILFFVGGLDKAHYFKGVNYLIKAFQLIASNEDYRLIIGGSGDMQKSYKTLVSNYGLERKVIFTGYISDDLLPLYYNLADTFILPSIDKSEAFGISILEAMSSGVAVIATDLPGVRNVVDKKKTGFLIKPRDVSQLAIYMRLLLDNPQMRNRFGKCAREKVLRKYTWTDVSSQINDLYQYYKV